MTSRIGRNRSNIENNVVANSLRSNIGWNLAGVGVYSLSLWALIAYIAIDDPSAAGQFGLGMAVVTPIFLFFGFNLRVVQAVDDDDHNWRNYEVIRGVMSVAGLATSVLVGWAIGDGFLLLTLSLGLARMAELWSFMTHGVFLAKKQLKPLGVGTAARGLLGAASGCLVWSNSGNVPAVGFALAISWGLVLLAYELPRARSMLREVGTFDPNSALKLVKRSVPLGVDSAANSLIHHAPRLLIASILGPVALGLYLPVVQLAQYGTVVAGSLGNAFLSQLASSWRSGETAAFRKLLFQIALFGSIGGVVFAGITGFLGPPSVRILLGTQFVDRPLILLVGILVGVISIQRLLARGLQAVGDFSSVLIIDVLMLIVIVLSGSWFVRIWGNAGAASAMLAGFTAGLGLVVVSLLRLRAREKD